MGTKLERFAAKGSTVEKDTRPSWICTTPRCKRVATPDFECWLCPDCKKKLDERIKQLEARTMQLEIDRDMWKGRTRELQKEQAEVMHYYFIRFSEMGVDEHGGSGLDKALERTGDLLDKYDPGWREK